MELQSLSNKYTVRTLGPNDVEVIYALASQHTKFYEYCPPFVSRESILADMSALPPGVSAENKFYFGFFDGKKLMAVMDLVLGFPGADTAFIGLFMMDTVHQGRGAGSAIITEAAAALKAEGFERLRLARAKGNPQPEAFWRKNGFTETGEENDNGPYTVVLMEREL